MSPEDDDLASALCPARAPRLLLVDDEPMILNALSRTLRRGLGRETLIDVRPDGAAAVAALLAWPYDAVISDLRMPGMDGMALLARAAQIQPGCLRMILTGTADFETAQRAVNEFGIYRYLTKPWDAATLVRSVSDALAQGQAQRRDASQAAAWAARQGQLSAQEMERRRLEQLEPGLTRVELDDDGCVVMPPLGPDLSMPR